MKVTKRILSAILSTAVLSGTITAIPVFADSTVTETSSVVVNENFDNVELTASKSKAMKQIDGTDVYYRTHPYSDEGNVSVSVAENAISNKSLMMDLSGTDSEMAFVSVKPSNAVDISKGDALHINFDAKLNFTKSGTEASTNIKLLLGTNYNTDVASPQNDAYFTPLPGSASFTECSNANSSTAIKDKAAVAVLNGKGMYLGSAISSDPNYAEQMKNKVNVDIVIDTEDALQNGVQTIKETYTYTKSDNTTSTITYYAKYDANYSGAGDEDADVISQFTELRFQLYSIQDSKLYLDNVEIEKLTRSKKYYTSAVKNVINYDFSNAKDFTSTDKWNVCAPVDESGNVYFSTMYEGSGSGKVEKVAGPNGSDVFAFKQSIGSAVSGNAFNILTLRNPNVTTKINDGDIIRFSYDLKHDAKQDLTSGTQYAPIYFFSPMLNSPRYDSNNIWFSGQYGITQNSNVWLGSDTDTKEVSTHTAYRNGFLLETETTNSAVSTRLLGRKTSGEAVTSNQWHHYEYIINTSDKTKDGKQTVKVYIDKGTSNEIVLYNTLDTNIKDSAENKYTEFNTLEMFFTRINCNSDAGSIYSTNYKLDIITPGFGISGTAIENHDPSDSIVLEPGKKLKVTCALNIPGTDKKTNDEDYPKYTYTIYAAQYEGDRLIGIQPIKKDFTEDEYSAEFEVDVLSDADGLKLFAFDENLKPLIVNQTASVSDDVDTNAISYSLNQYDMH